MGADVAEEEWAFTWQYFATQFGVECLTINIFLEKGLDNPAFVLA